MGGGGKGGGGGSGGRGGENGDTLSNGGGDGAGEDGAGEVGGEGGAVALLMMHVQLGGRGRALVRRRLGGRHINNKQRPPKQTQSVCRVLGMDQCRASELMA